MAKKDKGRAVVEKKAVALKKLVVEYVPHDSIRPNAYNPNKQSEHDFELLCKSMAEDGFTQPVIVHRESRQIVDGEHRWRASGKLGYTEIPVVFVDMTPEQMRIATLRHNRARGEEDIELTAQVLRDLQELGAADWAQDSLMLDDEEMNRLLQETDVPDALAGEDFSPAWEPSAERATDRPTDTKTTEVKTGDGTVVCAGSTGAVEAQRERAKRLEEARTEEERAKAREETKVFRLNLVFSGLESDLVRETLGEHPAERLVRIARFLKTIPELESKLDAPAAPG